MGKTNTVLIILTFVPVIFVASYQYFSITKTPIVEFGNETDWCGSITLCGELHTMCDFKNDEPGGDCQNYTKIHLTSRFKIMALHFLNYRRNLVAGGNEYRLPSATKMMMLQWDETLATFAQRWANQCIYHPSILKFFRPLTDSCRDHPHFGVVQYGMVIHSKRSDRDFTLYDLMTFLINVASSDSDGVTNHILHSGYIPVEDDGAVLFYANANKLGCGAAAFDVYTTNSTYYNRTVSIICNLGPVEKLYLQDPYYTPGTPCTACPMGSECDNRSNFKYLCQSHAMQYTYDDAAEEKLLEANEKK